MPCRGECHHIVALVLLYVTLVVGVTIMIRVMISASQDPHTRAAYPCYIPGVALGFKIPSPLWLILSLVHSPHTPLNSHKLLLVSLRPNHYLHLFCLDDIHIGKRTLEFKGNGEEFVSHHDCDMYMSLDLLIDVYIVYLCNGLF